jgi:DNA polymerase-1
MEIEDLGEEEGLDSYEKPTKTLLLDADTLAFAAGSVNEYADDLLPREMYTDAEWEEIISSPQFDEEEMCIWRQDVDKSVSDCIDRIVELQEITFTKDVVLFFTETRKNFRYAVYPDYKANRKSTRYPPDIKKIKEKLLEKYQGEICEEIEADDAVVYLKRTNPQKYVLCSCDKDVYRSVAGKHFNYYRSEKYDIPMKWVETTQEEAEEFPYIQCLTGDSTDNISGCPGIGAKRAIKVLRGCTTDEERWCAVVDAYKKKGLSESVAIMNMRLVSMDQVYKDEKGNWQVKLWLPTNIKKEI